MFFFKSSLICREYSIKCAISFSFLMLMFSFIPVAFLLVLWRTVATNAVNELHLGAAHGLMALAHMA